MPRRLLASLAATLLLAHTAPTAWPQPPAQPLFTPTELTFLQHMIVHHEQALTMSSWVAERGGREEFVRFARYVARAQAAEIAEMRALLDLAAERGLTLPDSHLHGDPPMPGMLSSAEMDAIAAASGAEFERLWLEGLIRHHEGAIAMARAQQQAQLASGRQPYELSVLVEDILIEQRAEIARMREWLESTPARAPLESTPVRTPLLWLPAGGCGVDLTLDEFALVCGYDSIALNEDGSRILTIDFGGRIRLFDDSGRLLAEHATRIDTRGTSVTPFFDGERPAALIGARLVTLDAATSEVVVDRVVVRDGDRAREEAAYLAHQPGLLFLRSYRPGPGDKTDGTIASVVDLDTGDLLHEQTNVIPAFDRDARRWAVGIARPGTSEGRSRFAIVHADRDLSLSEIPESCEPIGPRPRCVSFDRGTSSGAVLDLVSGERSPFDVSAIVKEAVLARWLEAGDSTIGILGTRRATGAMGDAFAIVDLQAGRELLRFEAFQPQVAVGTDARGRPEIRLATPTAGGRYVIRRVSPDGKLTIVGEASHDGFTLTAPRSDIFLANAEDPDWVRAIDPAGLTRALFWFRSVWCRHVADSGACVASLDGRRLAMIRGDRAVLFVVD